MSVRFTCSLTSLSRMPVYDDDYCKKVFILFPSKLVLTCVLELPRTGPELGAKKWKLKTASRCSWSRDWPSPRSSQRSVTGNAVVPPKKRDHYKVPFEDISYGIRLVGGDCMGSQTSRFNLLNELLSELAYWKWRLILKLRTSVNIRLSVAVRLV